MSAIRSLPQRIAWLAVAVACLGSAEARAQRVVIEDAVEIQLRDREIWAFLDRGGPLREPLEKGEFIVSSHSKGRVGLVITNRRALAVSPDAPEWIEAPRRLSERPFGAPLVGDRLAMLLSDQRILVYDAQLAGWLESSVGPHEALVDARVSSALAIAVTDRRAVGTAAGAGRLSEIALQIGEVYEGLSALADVATLTTSRRFLTFRGLSNSWGDTPRRLR